MYFDKPNLEMLFGKTLLKKRDLKTKVIKQL